MINRTFSTSTLLVYSLRSSMKGGFVGGMIGGVTFILTIMLRGFLGILASNELVNLLNIEGATPLGILYGYCGLFLLGIIGGIGLGVSGAIVAGPLSVAFLHRLNPQRNWTTTGTVLGSVVGTVGVLVFTGDNVLSVIRGTDTDVVGLFLAHLSGTLGGAFGGAIAGARLERLLTSTTELHQDTGPGN